MYEGSKMQSQIKNACSLTPELKESGDANLDLYKCMDFDLNHNNPLEWEKVIKSFNEEFSWKAKDIVDMKDHIINKWQVYLFSLGTIVLDGAEIQAPRIGICANDISIRKSNVTADGGGCKPDEGWGNQPRKAGCSGSGASHGGNGGSGSSFVEQEYWHKTCNKESETSKLYYEGREARFEGSGGTCGDNINYLPGRFPWSTHRLVPGFHGGSGGGIVWLTTPRTIDIKNSTISANGHDGHIEKYKEAGSGGGSGGSIQL